MAKLKVILMDDEGQELSQRDYGLEAKTSNLSGLERAIEELRPQVLGDLIHDLLALEQATYKKTLMVSKGSYPIKIKTINGSFKFKVNRYQTPEGIKSWLRLTDRKSRGQTLLYMIFHQAHHRGQITVLMRQAGLKVVGIYSPAQEEWAEQGMPAIA
jgi:hypothetical protein